MIGRFTNRLVATAGLLSVLVPALPTPACAQSGRWDSLLSNSYWYVPVPNLFAYVASNQDFTSPPPIPSGDQTLWTLGTATNGLFTGTSEATFTIGPVTLLSNTTIQGLATDSGQMRMIFSSSVGEPTVGIGQIRTIGGMPQIEMQMVTGASLVVTHWAYMLPYNPATFTPPPAQVVPLDITSRQWAWTAGTTWSIVSPTLFGSNDAGTFKITDNVNGYFWGPGTGPVGSTGTNFTELGSITPEGNVLFAVSFNGVLQYLTGVITGDATTGRMVLRGYTSADTFDTFGLAEIMPPSNIAAGMTYFASNLGSQVLPAFAGGTLQIDATGQTYPQAFTLDGSATNTIDQRGNTATFSGVFSDATPGTPGRLVISNSGSGGGITFIGNNTYTGPTTVASGAALAINGSVASPVLVDAGGVLRGTGTIGGAVTIAPGGVLAPGGSPGTLTVLSSVSLAAGSFLNLDIDGPGTGTGAGNFSRLQITGALAADGTLVPRLRGIVGSATNRFTPALGQQFQVITAQGGITGGFSGLTQPLGLADGTRFDALYGANTLTLTVTPAAYGNLGLAGLPQSANQAAVGAALDATRPAAGIAMTAAQSGLYAPLYVLAGSFIAPALEQLAPTIYGDALMVRREAWALVGDAIHDQLAVRRGTGADPSGRTIWLTGLGRFGTVGSDGASGYSSRIGGTAGGVDMQVTPNLILGVAFGFTHQAVTAQNGASYAGNAAQFEFYGSLREGIGFLDLHAGGGFSDGTTQRPQYAYGVQARGNLQGLSAGGSLRAGVQLGAGDWRIEPSLTLGGGSFGQDGVTETQGGPVGQSVRSATVGSLQTLLGVRVERRFAIEDGVAVVPSAQVGWLHEYLDDQGTTTAALLGMPGTPFTVRTASVGRDAAVVALRATLETGGPLTVYAGYAGTLSGASRAQSVSAGLRLVW